MTDANNVMNPQHFGRDPADIHPFTFLDNIRKWAFYTIYAQSVGGDTAETWWSLCNLSTSCVCSMFVN